MSLKQSDLASLQAKVNGYDEQAKIQRLKLRQLNMEEKSLVQRQIDLEKKSADVNSKKQEVQQKLDGIYREQHELVREINRRSGRTELAIFDLPYGDLFPKIAGVHPSAAGAHVAGVGWRGRSSPSSPSYSQSAYDNCRGRPPLSFWQLHDQKNGIKVNALQFLDCDAEPLNNGQWRRGFRLRKGSIISARPPLKEDAKYAVELRDMFIKFGLTKPLGGTHLKLLKLTSDVVVPPRPRFVEEFAYIGIPQQRRAASLQRIYLSED